MRYLTVEADADPTNELQTLGTSGNNITLSDGGGSVTAPFATSAGDADTVDGEDYNNNWPTTLPNVQNACTNDFHNIGGTDNVDDADADPTNELNASVSFDGTNLNITDAGGTLSADLSSLQDDGVDWTEITNIPAGFADGIDNTCCDGGPDSYTKLLLHMDSVGLIDSSPSSHPVTLNGNVTRSSDQSKFGGYSAYFDGDGDYLSIPDSEDWSFGAEDFTIDFWVWFEDLNDIRNIFDFKDDGGDSQGLSHSSITLPSPKGWWFWDRSGAGVILEEGSVSTPSQTWVHVALVRCGSNWKLYVNGNLVVSYALSTTLTDPTNLNIGYCHDGLWYLKGYIDEFRVSKGIARWTSDFTPPSAPYGVGGIGDGHSLDAADGSPKDAVVNGQ